MKYKPQVLVDRMWQTRAGRLSYLLSDLLYEYKCVLLEKCKYDLRDPAAIGKGTIPAVEAIQQAQEYLEELAFDEVHAAAKVAMPEWAKAALEIKK